MLCKNNKNNKKYTRAELQNQCKKYGIKGNITSENMIKCIELALLGKSIPNIFRKLTWFEIHKNKIITSISVTSLIISMTTLILLFRRTQ